MLTLVRAGGDGPVEVGVVELGAVAEGFPPATAMGADFGAGQGHDEVGEFGAEAVPEAVVAGVEGVEGDVGALGVESVVVRCDRWESRGRGRGEGNRGVGGGVGATDEGGAGRRDGEVVELDGAAADEAGGACVSRLPALAEELMLVFGFDVGLVIPESTHLGAGSAGLRPEGRCNDRRKCVPVSFGAAPVRRDWANVGSGRAVAESVRADVGRVVG